MTKKTRIKAINGSQTALPLFTDPITDPITTPIETPPGIHVDTMDTYKATPIGSSNSVQSVQPDQKQETLGLDKKLHLGHKYQYTFHYEGAQPIPKDAQVYPHGRSGSHKQAIFDWTAREKVQTFTGGTLMITIFHPEGQRTPAEADDAFNRATACMKQIARKFGLADWKMVKQSHSEHIVKDLSMDRALRPLVKAEPKLFRDRVGLVLDNTHKEYPAPKGEFNLEYKQADERKDIKPKDIVSEMEFIHDNRKMLNWWIEEGVVKIAHDLELLKDAQVRQFGLLEKIGEGMVRMVKILEKLMGNDESGGGGSFPMKPIDYEGRDYL